MGDQDAGELGPQRRVRAQAAGAAGPLVGVAGERLVPTGGAADQMEREIRRGRVVRVSGDGGQEATVAGEAEQTIGVCGTGELPGRTVLVEADVDVGRREAQGMIGRRL